MQNKELHTLIDSILPEKLKLIQDEFLLYGDIIEDQNVKEIDFSYFWKIQKEEFLKLMQIPRQLLLQKKLCWSNNYQAIQIEEEGSQYVAVFLFYFANRHARS